ncbi:MAG TPA: TetR/AcrR family transcriptional regulator [Candidatus Dormibacteraeota bacterium]|nr:TetR/AcrR family transcriptional regulator [Candidatus Dormibacteraeota bacterium]
MTDKLLAPGLSSSAQQRARHIAEAAAAVMSRNGYGGTTMKDIAAEAQVAPGLIHYYFDSKEDLLLAVVRMLCEEMRQEAREAFAASSGAAPIARAWATLQTAQTNIADKPDRQRLMFECIALAMSEPRVREQLIELYVDLLDTTSGMVDELNTQVPTPLPVPARDFAAVIVAAIDGITLQQLIDPSRDAAALYRALGFILLSGVAASYAVAGLPTPSLEDFAALLGTQPEPQP